MYGQEVEKIIEEYLKNSKAKYAIMIDGDWGSGKTYFLTQSLMKSIKDKEVRKKQKRKYAYVSLYGMKSISEVSKKILFQYFGKRNEKKAELANEVIETATQVLTATLEDVIIDFSKIEKRLEKIDIKNWIICFDDLERCSLPIDEILGYINQLVEHNGCKVIILANEKEIGKISLNRKIEEKYKVILSGKTLRLDRQSNTNNSVPADSLDKKGMEEGVKCCSSNYLRLHVALYLQPFSRLSRMPHHIIQSQLCTLNTVIQKRSTLFNPNEIADGKNIRVFRNE